jgi:hypothetical protein
VTGGLVSERIDPIAKSEITASLSQILANQAELIVLICQQIAMWSGRFRPRVLAKLSLVADHATFAHRIGRLLVFAVRSGQRIVDPAPGS